MLPLEAISIQVAASSPARRRVESMHCASRPRPSEVCAVTARVDRGAAPGCSDAAAWCCGALWALNPACTDSDGDALPDWADPDDDNDGVIDALDAAPLNPGIGAAGEGAHEVDAPQSGRIVPPVRGVRWSPLLGETIDIWA